MQTPDRSCRLIILGLTLFLVGCAGPRVMMPTPNVYLDAEYDPFAELNAARKSTEVSLFYITDRAPERDENGQLIYGSGRSASLGFGTAVVDLGDDISWQELVEASRAQRRLKPVTLSLRRIREIVRGPETPLPYKIIDGEIVEEPGQLAKRDEAAEMFRQVLIRQLALTPRKEVFVYIHGYHNSFADAAFAMAELWHFLGRPGVPLVYTWPAGYPGIFGYTYDRESSEFTVSHLRDMLNIISSYPEVEKIHVIAHSRGTDVAVDALRELTIAARAAGIVPKEKYKIHNFVLAAPDIDLQVAEQRMAGDKILLSVERFTVYTSPKDKAIGVANRFFQSPRGRLGTFGLDNVTNSIRANMEFGNANFAVVNFLGTTGMEASFADRFGHSYFRDVPTVSSDLVLMLRDDLDPGAPGRPLEPIGFKFWRIPPNYPQTDVVQ